MANRSSSSRDSLNPRTIKQISSAALELRSINTASHNHVRSSSSSGSPNHQHPEHHEPKRKKTQRVSSLSSPRRFSNSSIDLNNIVEEDWAQKMHEAETLYHQVASKSLDNFSSKSQQDCRCRSPYESKKPMGRGADYFDDFREFIADGGLGKYKNSVVVNIRVNGVFDLDMINGHFKASYYIDMAFWVPIFESEFYASEDTIGTFSTFEPQIYLPDALESTFVGRSVEFSQHHDSRQHEIQLGQNREWNIKLSPKNGHLNSKHFKHSEYRVQANDACSHWPRLWRVMLTHNEVVSLQQTGSIKTPFKQATERLRWLFDKMDAERKRHLSHDTEGIMFVTHEIDAVCLEHFELEDFPYDTQALSIKLRLDKAIGDPMNRYLIPLCSDKGMFCTSRVSPLVEWSIAKNLDWIVEHGVSGNRSRDGGKQRLVARVLVVRKSYYYTLHYIGIAFSITTIVFSAFLAPPQSLDVRASTVLTLLLTVVAFNYVCQDKIPNVPYATVLDSFLIANHVMILLVGVVIVFFNFCYDYKERYIPRLFGGYNPEAESIVGGILFIVWIAYNSVFYLIMHFKTTKLMHAIEHEEQLGFLDFKSQTVNVSDHTLSSLTGAHAKKARALKAAKLIEQQRKAKNDEGAQMRALAHRLDTLSQVAMARDDDGDFIYEIQQTI